jgi:undecaprenyl diphosphate synthase
MALRIPKHLAVIMDGNGRWAAARGLPRIQGHTEGAKSVSEVVRACRELGVGVLTLYSFSTENWSRPSDEVAALMQLLHDYMVEKRSELVENQIRLKVIGQIHRLPVPVRLVVESVRRATEIPSARMILNLAISYGGRSEIAEAARDIAFEVARGKLDPKDIDEAVFSAHLQTAGLPDPDLVIRTSGEMRISNFLLWQMAYSEIVVTPTLWPDFRKPQLLEAFEEYSLRERRFGRVQAT